MEGQPADIVKSPERGGEKISPQVARFVVATVAPEFWDPEKKLDTSNVKKIKESLQSATAVEVAPLARLKIRNFDEVQTDFAQWQEYRQGWMDYYYHNPTENPDINNALDALKLNTNGEGYKGRLLYAEYLHIPSDDQPRAWREQTVAQNAKNFMTRMIDGCKDGDMINMSTLKRRLLAIDRDFLDDPGLMQATMAEAILRMPEKQKAAFIDQALASVNQEVGQNHKDRFRALAWHAEPTPPDSGPTQERKEQLHPVGIEYQASSNQGGRSYNEDAYFTPDGVYLPVKVPGEEPQLHATLSGPLSETYARKQAEYLSRFLKFTDIQFSPDYILGLQGRLTELIQDGKLQGLAIAADGMGGYAGGDLGSSIGIVIALNHVINNHEQANKEQLLRDAIIESDRVMGLLNSSRRIVINKDEEYVVVDQMGATMAITLTDAQGVTSGARAADARIYLRDKQTSKVESLFEDSSLVFSLLSSRRIMPSELFKHPQKNIIFSPIQDGSLGEDPDAIHTFGGVNLSKDQQLILCSDGVWEEVSGRLLDEPNVQAVLQKADELYIAEISRGIDGATAGRRAMGLIFAEVNLKETKEDGTLVPLSEENEEELANYLTRSEVGRNSGDNVVGIICSPASRK